MRPTHQELIIDQFTRQATPFAEKPEHWDDATMKRLSRFAGLEKTDTVLDVACGPGLLACAFASKALTVTGIDLTPAMIGKAKELQAKKGLSNVTWEIGDSSNLPYPDDTFSKVVTRYSFHHFPHPLEAWREMVRVCRPGGTVMVVDVALPPDKAKAYDSFETLRDPSHMRALTLVEFPLMAEQVGLNQIRTDFYRVAMESEGLIETSFPEWENRQKLRDLLRQDLGKDDLGLEVEQRGNQIWLSFPTFVISGNKYQTYSSPEL